MKAKSWRTETKAVKKGKQRNCKKARILWKPRKDIKQGESIET